MFFPHRSVSLCHQQVLTMLMSIEIGVKLPLTVIDMPKDGTCLFHSISHIVISTNLLHQEVRETIADYIIANWEHYGLLGKG